MIIFESQKPNLLDLNFFGVFILILFLIVDLLFIFKGYTLIKKRSERPHKRMLGSLPAVVLSVIIVIMFVSIIYNKIWDRNLYNSYINGEAKIVQGYVEDFSPAPKTGHAPTKFMVDGLEFSCYHEDDTKLYYTQAIYDLKEGQTVKIWYIDNHIMKLEVYD